MDLICHCPFCTLKTFRLFTPTVSTRILFNYLLLCHLSFTTPTPYFHITYKPRVVGFEPTHLGTKIPCLNHLAIPPLCLIQVRICTSHGYQFPYSFYRYIPISSSNIRLSTAQNLFPFFRTTLCVYLFHHCIIFIPSV